MKKILCAVLVLTLAAGLFVPVFAAGDMPFPDVDEDALYAEAVRELYEEEIILGDENGYYNPENNVTRAEMATFICRILDEVENAQAIKTSSFTDVPGSLWSVGYVARATELGIVRGYGDGRFGPENPVTVEEAAKMLVCAWGYEEQAVEAGGWPSGYLSVAEGLGILDGVSSASNEPANRAEIAMMVYWTLLSPTADEQGGYGE